MTDSEAARFFAKVDAPSPEACWLWSGAMTGNGYGAFGIRGRMQLAHRVSFEHARGAIGAGLVIDHRCNVRRCVNPAHLEAVTPRVNLMRGWLAAAARERVA